MFQKFQKNFLPFYLVIAVLKLRFENNGRSQCYLAPVAVLFVLTDRQKEGFCHQPHAQAETVGEGIALGYAVHLVHAVLKLLKRFLLLFRERFSQLLSVPGDQLQQFLKPFVISSALLEG